MKQMKRPLIILNLAGELFPELRDYFASRNIMIIDRSEAESKDFTHIITTDIVDFDSIHREFKVGEHKRQIISVSKITDLQNFTLNNGNMIIDNVWFKGQMGAFIMDKYLQGFSGYTPGENYPTFKEHGSFNIANPFNTGEYLDRMVQSAFETNVEALSVKTYFDHLIMYLAGLKNKGKAGFPFEVTYGSFEDVFALQVHLFGQDLKIPDVTTALSSSISKKAEEYFLNVTVQASDFFDFSYMPEVNKIVVTGLWTQDRRVNFENRGMMFCSLIDGAALTSFEGGSVSTIVKESTSLLDFTNKVIIPSSLPEGVTKTTVKGLNDSEESVTTVNGHTDVEDDSLVLLEGSDETSDEARLIAGDKELDELVQSISGKFEEEDKSILRIGGNKLDVDKAAYKIAATVDQSTKENDLQVRSLGDTLPGRIKTGLFDFANGMGKSAEDMDDFDLAKFQSERMPQIIQKSLVKEANAAALSRTVVSKGIGGEFNLLLEKKLTAQKNENEKLRNHLKTLATEVRLLKENRRKLSEIQLKSAEAAALESGIPKDDDEELRRHYQLKLLEQQALNEQDQKKLSALLERESRLIADVKQEEIKAKKIHIESIKKESFFSQELEKVERTNKAKDLIIIKTKETFAKLMEKKVEEIATLKSKNDQLTRAIANAPTATQGQLIKDLERQNQNLNKQLEVYKVKITSLASNMKGSKDDDILKEEARKLQMSNQQLKNQLDALKKENEKLHLKTKNDEAQIISIRQDKQRIEGILRKTTAEAKEMNINSSGSTVQINANDQEFKRIQAQNQILETHVKETTMKMVALEAKLAEAQKAQKTHGHGEEGSKVKLGQLENSVKKLTQDLVESRNQLAEMKKETNKLRQEKTALQNQIDKMKKEAEKAKPATPKKGGKAA